MVAERKIYGIFMAGGNGSRMGADIPKQFLEIDGKTILQMTIERFLKACPEMKIVVALPKDQIETWKNICALKPFTVPQVLVEGGLTRFHSVQNALRKVPDGAIALIQDGVRPFASETLIREIVNRVASAPAVIPVIPITDTLKSLERTNDGFREFGNSAPDRTKLFGAQTPQAFHSEVIKNAYTQAYDINFTDDASVAKKAGVPIEYTDGEVTNIKITTPFDLKIAKAVSL